MTLRSAPEAQTRAAERRAKSWSASYPASKPRLDYPQTTAPGKDPETPRYLARVRSPLALWARLQNEFEVHAGGTSYVADGITLRDTGCWLSRGLALREERCSALFEGRCIAGCCLAPRRRRTLAPPSPDFPSCVGRKNKLRTLGQPAYCVPFVWITPIPSGSSLQGTGPVLGCLAPAWSADCERSVSSGEVGHGGKRQQGHPGRQSGRRS